MAKVDDATSAVGYEQSWFKIEDMGMPSNNPDYWATGKRINFRKKKWNLIIDVNYKEVLNVRRKRVLRDLTGIDIASQGQLWPLHLHCSSGYRPRQLPAPR